LEIYRIYFNKKAFRKIKFFIGYKFAAYKISFIFAPAFKDALTEKMAR